MTSTIPGLAMEVPMRSKPYTFGMASPRFHAARVLCLRVALAVALPACILGAAAPMAGAQVTQKTVTGKVVDKGGAPVKNAVVYLKDDRTMAVKSFLADEGGNYRFAQLAQGTDYDIWAEADGKKSGTKTVSSFDAKTAVNVTLKIDK